MGCNKPVARFLEWEGYFIELMDLPSYNHNAQWSHAFSIASSGLPCTPRPFLGEGKRPRVTTKLFYHGCLRPPVRENAAITDSAGGGGGGGGVGRPPRPPLGYGPELVIVINVV